MHPCMYDIGAEYVCVNFSDFNIWFTYLQIFEVWSLNFELRVRNMFVVIKNIVLNIYSFLLYYVHVQCMYFVCCVLAAFVYNQLPCF